MNDQERIKGFQREFKELLVKYRPEVMLDAECYHDYITQEIDCSSSFAFRFNGETAVESWGETGVWDFGNGWEQINKEES